MSGIGAIDLQPLCEVTQRLIWQLEARSETQCGRVLTDSLSCSDAAPGTEFTIIDVAYVICLHVFAEQIVILFMVFLWRNICWRIIMAD